MSITAIMWMSSANSVHIMFEARRNPLVQLTAIVLVRAGFLFFDWDRAIRQKGITRYVYRFILFFTVVDPRYPEWRVKNVSNDSRSRDTSHVRASSRRVGCPTCVERDSYIAQKNHVAAIQASRQNSTRGLSVRRYKEVP